MEINAFKEGIMKSGASVETPSPDYICIKKICKPKPTSLQKQVFNFLSLG